MKTNIIQSESYQFSIRIINLYRYLVNNKRDFVLSKQILRSGTSIGANIEEALGGQSKKDFIAKLTIAYKETWETGYWVRLLRDTNFIESNDALSVLSDCNELSKIIIKILKTSKQKTNNS